jgi:hypothetical protein
MPHAAIKLVPSVNTNATEAANENAGISFSNLIRFFFDPSGSHWVQKLGGWLKYFPTPMVAIVRALWAWEDLEINTHLAVGTKTVTGQAYAQLSVITGGTQQIITPTSATSSITNPTITVTIGSPSIKITDVVTTGITNANSVYIPTQIAVGGVVLFGLYPCDPDGFSGANQYTVYATDILGNMLVATGTFSPALPTFTTTAGSNEITVNLAFYPYPQGTTFPILVETSVGGLTLFGNYVIQTLIDVGHFTIHTPTLATSGQTVTLNAGAAILQYSGSGSTPPSATAINANDWTLENFGEILVACPTETNATTAGYTFQPIYTWDETATTATIIPQAPPVNDGIFVAMPQRQIVAWGSTQTGIQDPLLVSWCDIGNFNQWIPLITNQAGSYRIPKGSHIVGCVQGPQQALIWTDIDVWSMQYIGPPYVYSFNEVGSGCGLIGRKAAAAVNGIYYWMGPFQFYTLSSAGVQPLPCSVWDVVFQNLNTSINGFYLQNIRVAVNSRFGEIQWFYPSASSPFGENDSYVKYNIYLNTWDYGSLGRSAWVDQSVLGAPIGADPVSFYLYQHETSNDADGQPMLSSVQTGYNAIGEGDVKSFVDWVWPDFKWGQYSQAQTANVQISFYVVDYPGDTPTVYGPYTVTQATEYFYTRFRGRLVSVKISSADLGSFWRIGQVRYRFAPDGKI